MSRQSLGLWVYLAVTFGAAWAIELGPVRQLGLTAGRGAVTWLLIAVMFAPTLGALLARLVEGSGFGDAGLRWGRGRVHLVAWLLPFGLALVATVITLLVGAGQLDLSGNVLLEKLPEAQRQAAAAQIRPYGAWFPLIVVAGALTQGVLITSLATFGEEFGWRGTLQPRLMHLGPTRAYLLVGLIWGIWHAPIIVQGHNYPGHPVSGAFMMVAFCIVLSFIFGWLFQRSGSIISPSLAHASINSPGGSLMVFIRGSNPLIGNMTGVIGILVMLAFILWLGVTGRLAEPATPPQPENPMETGEDP